VDEIVGSDPQLVALLKQGLRKIGLL